MAITMNPSPIINSSGCEDAHTLICRSAYNDAQPRYHLIGAHSIIILTFLFLTYLIISFSRKRHLFPIRERAPKLAIAQAVSFSLILVVTYIVELMIANNVNWCSETIGNIPFSRRLLKAIYSSMRLLSYFVFSFRYACY
jgi:hypothetical protein